MDLMDRMDLMDEEQKGADVMKKNVIWVGMVWVIGLVLLCPLVKTYAAEKARTAEIKANADIPLNPPSKGDLKTAPEKAEKVPTVLDVAVSKIVRIVGNTADEMRTTAKERAAITWTLNAVMQASAAYQQYQ